MFTALVRPKTHLAIACQWMLALCSCVGANDLHDGLSLAAGGDVVPAGDGTAPKSLADQAPTTASTTTGLDPSHLPPSADAPAASDPTAMPLSTNLSGYTKRSYVHGMMVICSHDVVSDEAHAQALYTLEHVLTKQQAFDLRHVGASVLIVGNDEHVTQFPGFSGLAKSFDTTAGFANWSSELPTVVVREFLMTPSILNPYTSENVLVHEMAHGLHMKWLYPDKLEMVARIDAAYAQAKASGAYGANSYAMSNKMEYFAEGAQIYTNATVRLDDNATGGMSRAKMPQEDSDLYHILQDVYGLVPWDCAADKSTLCFADAH